MKRLKVVRRVFSKCENAFLLFAVIELSEQNSVCVRARACVFVCVCVCISVRKIVYILSSLKYIPLFDAIHTSMIVATHVILL